MCIDYTCDILNSSFTHVDRHDKVNGVDDFIDLDLQPVLSVVGNDSDILISSDTCNTNYLEVFLNSSSEQNGFNDTCSQSFLQFKESDW